MSWEFASCPECTGLMERAGSSTDAEGRIHIAMRCPFDGTELDAPEPDDNFESRKAMGAL